MTERAKITQQALPQHLEQSRDRLLEITRRWQKGFLSDEERARCFRAEQERGFHGFLRANGLTLRIRPESWPGFLADYAQWTKGEPPAPTPGQPWLCSGGGEADAGDKSAVFQLMAFYRLTPALFRPCHRGCLRPELDLRAYGTSLSGLLRFRPVRGAEILDAPNPAGKRCVLEDSRGLKARLTVLRPASDEERRNNRISPDWITEGTIEGFTAARIHRILLSRPDPDGVMLLETSLDSEDLQVLREFPLWAEYHKWEAARQGEYDACLQSLIRSYDANYPSEFK